MMVSSLEPHTAEIANVFQRLFVRKHRARILLPESLATLTKHLDETYLDSKSGGSIDFDLFHSIGLIFSARRDPITMGELSRSLDVPLSTATRIVDWLVKNNYAQRLSDPNDRRVVRVDLTEEGHVMYRSINEFMVERVEQILSIFTPQERVNLTQLLLKLLNKLEEPWQLSMSSNEKTDRSVNH
jgi:DNA-binding MarR family transcriptional regulator